MSIKNDVDNVSGFIRSFTNEAQKLSGAISSIKAGDNNINVYLNVLKRLSAQAMDLGGEINRQLSFLQHQVNYQEQTKRMQDRRDKESSDRENRRKKYEKLSQS